MASVSRTYTFTDGTDALGSEVETEFDTIYDAWNNHDAGTSAWTVVKSALYTATGAAPATPTADSLYSDNIIKGWIMFDGTGTVSIYDDFNVNSLVDSDTGDYTITWETDLDSANYAVLGSANAAVILARDNAQSSTAGITYVTCFNTSASAVDTDLVSVAVVGD